MDELVDGTCGIYSFVRTKDGKYLRCTHRFGHEGLHSWQYVDEQTGQIRDKGAIYIST